MPQNQSNHEQAPDRSKEFEQALENQGNAQFLLRLYVTGLTARSTHAIDNIKDICEHELKGHYALEVVDLAKQPELAKREDIIVAPTLVKLLPLPLRRLIGDLSDRQRVLRGLDLCPKS